MSVRRPSLPNRRARRLHLAPEILERRALMAVDVSYFEQIEDLALDAAGNVYAVGDMYRPIDFDPGAGTAWRTLELLSSPGSIPEALYLVSYDPAGALRTGWPVQFPHYAGDVAIDTAGTVYVTGAMNGVGKVTAYSPEGQPTWSAPTARLSDPASGSFFFWGIATDATGLYVSGMMQDDVDLDLDGDPATVEASNRRTTPASPLIAKYDLATRAFLWATSIEGTAYKQSPVIAADGASLFVAGRFYTGPNGGSVLTGTPYEMTERNLATYTGTAQDSYLIEVDPATGQPRRAAHLVDFQAKSVAADATGVYLGGDAYVNGPADIDPGAATRLLDDAIVARFTPAPDAATFRLEWASNFVFDNRGDGAADIALHGGKVYATGHIFGGSGATVDFDPDPTRTHNLTSLGRWDGYVWALNAADGSFGWAELVGSTETPWTISDNEYGTAIAAGAGGVYTGGVMNWGPADFDREAAYADGRDRRLGDTGTDGYVVRHGLDGSFGWVVQLGGVHRTVEDELAGYSETGSGWKDAGPNSGGYQRDMRIHAKGTGSSTARWSFTGLPAGQYDILATWRPNSKYATDARYTVNGTALPLVNQRLAPDDVRDQMDSSLWKRIGTVIIAEGGNITVVLSDKANGSVVADAVRVVSNGPPAVMATSAGPGTARGEALTAAQALPVVRQAARSWGRLGYDVSGLEGLQVQVADLGGGRLATMSGSTLTLDADAVGNGWFVDATPGRHEEFRHRGLARTARPGSAAEGRIDLLSVALHELGHWLGQDHHDEGVMAETLSPGVRLLPGALTHREGGLSARDRQTRGPSPLAMPRDWLSAEAAVDLVGVRTRRAQRARRA